MTVDSASGGLMDWADAVSGPLSGCTCLWQDLDGLHVEPPPAQAPPTSILWGWRGSAMVRVRIDGDDAYVAMHDAAAAERTVPWGVDDGRIAASAGRGPGPDHGGVGAEYEQFVVGGLDAGPITFVRPAGENRAARDG